MTSPARIALFGGSFDPVHLGHLEIARRAVEALALDQVRFLPARRSPHKQQGPLASDDDRVALLEAATRDLPWAVIDRFDLDAPPPSYSVRTAREMHRRFPESELYWIVGRDQWDALPRWKDADQLAELLDFIVFSRDGHPEPRPGWRMHPVSGTHPASSSAIRSALAAGKAPPPWLPEGTAEIIRERKLYAAGG